MSAGVRLVLDTNIVVSALLWRGTPHELVLAARTRPVAFFTSPILLAELADIRAPEVGGTGRGQRLNPRCVYAALPAACHGHPSRTHPAHGLDRPGRRSRARVRSGGKGRSHCLG